MDITIVLEPITLGELKKIAAEQYGDMTKAVVDLQKGILAIGGGMHADAESHLLAEGSRQEDLWGVNLYPDQEGEEFVQFESLINIRPRQDNRSMSVEDPEIQRKIMEVVHKMIR